MMRQLLGRAFEEQGSSLKMGSEGEWAFLGER